MRSWTLAAAAWIAVQVAVPLVRLDRRDDVPFSSRFSWSMFAGRPIARCTHALTWRDRGGREVDGPAAPSAPCATCSPRGRRREFARVVPLLTAYADGRRRRGRRPPRPPPPPQARVDPRGELTLTSRAPLPHVARRDFAPTLRLGAPMSERQHDALRRSLGALSLLGVEHMRGEWSASLAVWSYGREPSWPPPSPTPSSRSRAGAPLAFTLGWRWRLAGGVFCASLAGLYGLAPVTYHNNLYLLWLLVLLAVLTGGRWKGDGLFAAAVRWQVAFVYLASVVVKLSHPFWQGSGGVIRWLAAERVPMIHDGVVNPILQPLLVRPDVSALIDHATMAVEVAVPVMLLRPRWRRAGFALGVALHWGFQLWLHPQLFTFLMLWGYFAFAPPATDVGARTAPGDGPLGRAPRLARPRRRARRRRAHRHHARGTRPPRPRRPPRARLAHARDRARRGGLRARGPRGPAPRGRPPRGGGRGGARPPRCPRAGVDVDTTVFTTPALRGSTPMGGRAPTGRFQRLFGGAAGVGRGGSERGGSWSLGVGRIPPRSVPAGAELRYFFRGPQLAKEDLRERSEETSPRASSKTPTVPPSRSTSWC